MIMMICDRQRFSVKLIEPLPQKRFSRRRFFPSNRAHTDGARSRLDASHFSWYVPPSFRQKIARADISPTHSNQRSNQEIYSSSKLETESLSFFLSFFFFGSPPSLNAIPYWFVLYPFNNSTARLIESFAEVWVSLHVKKWNDRRGGFSLVEANGERKKPPRTSRIIMYS